MMNRNSTPEQIIAEAMQLTVEQRMVIAQQLLDSVPDTEQGNQQKLRVFLHDRIDAAEQGDLSNKSFSQIKLDARSQLEH